MTDGQTITPVLYGNFLQIARGRIPQKTRRMSGSVCVAQSLFVADAGGALGFHPVDNGRLQLL